MKQTMTSTNHLSTLQSEMVQLNHFREVNAMSEGFEIIIEDPISISEAIKITGYSRTQIKRYCIEYQETRGESGLKSKKLRGGRTSPWLIEKSAAEEFYKSNKNQTEK